ncbi:MAG: HAD family hydrolase [Eubacteriales bacterium]|nr:HAD family hydrolase [Eubacteriales bacterium]
MIDTVIFDLDGTLLYTIEDLTDGVNYAVRLFGYPQHCVDAVRKMVGNGIRNLIKRAIPDGMDNPDFENVFNAFKEFYTDNCIVKTRPYEGVVEVLEYLKREGFKTAIVSNKNNQAVIKLKEHFFDELIMVTIGQSDDIKKKPAPDMVLKAVQELGSDIGNCIYVGDSGVDYETARNAGMNGVIVSWGFCERAELEKLKDVTIIDKPSELLDMIIH